MVKVWSEVSVLIVGCGSIGKRHARVLHGLGVSDLRVCDPESVQRAALLAETPVVKMYDSLAAGLASAEIAHPTGPAGARGRLPRVV